MIHERLVAYHNSTQRLPEHILFYRDGVSESQYGMVKLGELPLIKAGCSKAGLQFLRNPGWCPSITLLVVGKRHHTRFFKLDPDNSNTANLPSGLVVDTEVVDPTCSNFYLQSHDSPLGTAKPGHYVVIENESDYSMGQLQILVGCPSPNPKHVLIVRK